MTWQEVSMAIVVGATLMGFCIFMPTQRTTKEIEAESIRVEAEAKVRVEKEKTEQLRLELEILKAKGKKDVKEDL